MLHTPSSKADLTEFIPVSVLAWLYSWLLWTRLKQVHIHSTPLCKITWYQRDSWTTMDYEWSILYRKVKRPKSTLAFLYRQKIAFICTQGHRWCCRGLSVWNLFPKAVLWQILAVLMIYIPPDNNTYSPITWIHTV